MNNSNCHARSGRCLPDLRDVHYYSSLIPRQHALVEQLISTSAHARSCFVGIERRCKCLVWASIPHDKLLHGFCLLEVLVDKTNGGNSIGSQFMVEQFFKVLKQTNNIAFNRVPYMIEKSFEKLKLKKNLINGFSQFYGVEHICEVLKKGLNVIPIIPDELKARKNNGIEILEEKNQNVLEFDNLKKDVTTLIKEAQEYLVKCTPLKIHSERIPILIKTEQDNVHKNVHLEGTEEEIGKENIEEKTAILKNGFPPLNNLDYIEYKIKNNIIKEDERNRNLNCKYTLLSVQSSLNRIKTQEEIINDLIEFEAKIEKSKEVRKEEENNFQINGIQLLIEEKTNNIDENNEVFRSILSLQCKNLEDKFRNEQISALEYYESIEEGSLCFIKKLNKETTETLLKEDKNDVIKVNSQIYESNEIFEILPFGNLERNIRNTEIQNYQSMSNLKQVILNENKKDSSKSLSILKKNERNCGEIIIQCDSNENIGLNTLKENIKFLKNQNRMFLNFKENVFDDIKHFVKSLKMEEIKVGEIILPNEKILCERIVENDEEVIKENLTQQSNKIDLHCEDKKSKDLKERNVIQNFGQMFYLSDNGIYIKKINENMLHCFDVKNDHVFVINQSNQNPEDIHMMSEVLIYASEKNINDILNIGRIEDLDNMFQKAALEGLQNKETLLIDVDSRITTLHSLQYLRESVNLEAEILSEIETKLTKIEFEETKMTEALSLENTDLLEDIIIGNEAILESHKVQLNNYISEENQIKPKNKEILYSGSKNVSHDEGLKEFNISSEKVVSKNVRSNMSSKRFSKIKEINNILSEVSIEPIINMLQSDFIMQIILPEEITSHSMKRSSEAYNGTALLKANTVGIGIYSSVIERSNTLKEKKVKTVIDPKSMKNNKNSVNKMKFEKDLNYAIEQILWKHQDKEISKDNNRSKEFVNKRKIYKGSILDKLITETLIRCKGVNSSRRSHVRTIIRDKIKIKNVKEKIHGQDFKMYRTSKFKEDIDKNIQNDKRILNKNKRRDKKPLKSINLYNKFGEEFVHSRGSNLIFLNKTNIKQKREEEYDTLELSYQYMNIPPSQICSVPPENNIGTWVVYDTGPQIFNSVKEFNVMQNQTSFMSKSTEAIRNKSNISSREIISVIPENGNTFFINNMINKSCSNKHNQEPLIMDYCKTGNNDFIKLDLLHSWESKTLMNKSKDKHIIRKHNNNGTNSSLFERNKSKNRKTSNITSFQMSQSSTKSEEHSYKFSFLENNYMQQEKDFIYFEESSNDLFKGDQINEKWSNHKTNTKKLKIINTSSIKMTENVVHVIVNDDESDSKDIPFTSKFSLRKLDSTKHAKNNIYKNFQEVLIKSTSSSSIEDVQINYDASETEKKTSLCLKRKNKNLKKPDSRSPFTEKFVNFPNDSWSSCFDFVLKQVMLNNYFTS